MNNKLNTLNSYNVPLNAQTLFLLSTSGSQSSIEKHNKALQSLGANLVYFTFGREIKPETYANLLKSPIVRGGAITGQGLKSGIISFMDKIDELAKCTGAVNTVINVGGKLYGYNTDAYGFESALRKHLDISAIKIKKAIIYGNGGVSGVAVHVLKKLGIEVTMAGRNQKHVDEKMKDLCLTSFDGPYDLVINATPASSLRLEEANYFMEVLKNCKMAFDHNMPEKDAKKNYLQEYCDKNKIYFIPGVDMYIPQMIKQWKLFLNGVNNDDELLKITEDDIAKFWELDFKNSL